MNIHDEIEAALRFSGIRAASEWTPGWVIESDDPDNVIVRYRPSTHSDAKHQLSEEITRTLTSAGYQVVPDGSLSRPDDASPSNRRTASRYAGEVAYRGSRLLEPFLRVRRSTESDHAHTEAPAPTDREQLLALLTTLSDDQVATVLAFAEALRRGHAVVSVCDPRETGTGPEDQLVGAVLAQRG
jgi:hypothetical protein